MIFFFLLGILFSQNSWSQTLVREYQEGPLNSFTNLCPTYRAAKIYDVKLKRAIQVGGISKTLFLKNGDVLVNRRIEDSLPAQKQNATLAYLYHENGSIRRFQIPGTINKQEAFYMGEMALSPNEKFMLTLADHYIPSTNEEFRALYLTDLVSGLSSQVFSQKRSDEKLVVEAKVDNEGKVSLFYEKTNSFYLQKDLKDYSGSVIREIIEQEGNVTHKTGIQSLRFLELGITVGEMSLSSCTFLSHEEIGPREARIVCEEGIYWLYLDLEKTLQDEKSQIIGFFPCGRN